MRRSGTIVKWNVEKAFGFVAPDDGADDVFLHLHGFVEKPRLPVVGDRVFYELESGNGDRPRAARVVLRPSGGAGAPLRRPANFPPAPVIPAARRSASPPSPTSRPVQRNRPTRAGRRESRFGVGTILILLLPANVLGLLWLAASRHFIPLWVARLYMGMSAVTALAYALDKFRAQRGKWRISESTLHLFEVAGGWPGAFAAQRLLRHKTRKVAFQITYWLIVLAHLAFWAWYAKRHLEAWD